MKSFLIPLALAFVLSACQKSAPEAAREELGRQKIEISPQTMVDAARAGDLERIKLLREAGADPGQPNAMGETPLWAALVAGQTGVIEMLSGTAGVPEPAAKVPLQSPGAQSSLAWALARRHTAVLKLLLDHGADPNQSLATPSGEDFIGVVADEHFSYYLRKEKNVKPVMLAAATGQLEAVELLLKAGADPDATTARHKTEAIWLAGKGHHVGIVQLLLGKDPRPEVQKLKVTVDLSKQRAILYRDGEPVDSSPISSGRQGYRTPKGAYVVTNKYRDWKSTLYEDASMPFFMRLSCGDFGMHAGALPGYPASHGCIRMPYEKAREFFSKVEVGTLVEIVD